MLKSYRRATALGVGASLLLGIVAACVGDDPQAASTPTTDGGNDGNSTNPNPNPTTSGGPGTDSGPDGSSCAGDTTLKKADGTTEECRFGCTATPSPHCGTIHPSGNAITTEMLSTAGIQAKKFELAGPTKFDTDTGAIEGARDVNDDPLTMQVKDGIGFKVAQIDPTHRIAIWVFDSVEVAAGAAIRFTSTNAAAFVVAKTAQITGVIDLRGYSDDTKLCTPTVSQQAMGGGPGAAAGSISHKQGGGLGGGFGPENPAYYFCPGPGGGGYGGFGGGGGAKDAGSGATNGGDGGSTYGEPTLNPLLGGSGGAGLGSYSGGGGGGAFHLVAGEKVTIGDGSSNGGINAGGCPGVLGDMGSPSGGGGSGGAVLVETPLIEIKPNAGIAANGGTGGPGTAGKIENARTQAFNGPGSGGGGSAPDGEHAFPASPSAYSANAGGGAAGRIRINTRTGNFSPPLTAILSPSLAAPGSPTTVGKLDVR